MKIGFLGLGTMGTPMALNLCRKFPVTVWNRSNSKYAPLVAAGAKVAEKPSQVVQQSDVIFTMLFDAPAIESTMNNDNSFLDSIRGKTLINTSSIPVDSSLKLANQIHKAGGDFIEMPVSGSKIPAEQGQLVGMMAGDAALCEKLKPIVEPLTKVAIYCGPIGSGLKAKYAANVFLITLTAGLAESMNLARAQGIDLEAFGQILDNGPMASAYSKIKIAKIINQDWSAQAALKDCFNNTELVKSAAQNAGAEIPLMQVCNVLYKESLVKGLDEDDMIAVYKTFDRSQG